MRPASVKSTASPFVKRKDKAGSKPLEIDWDRVEPGDNHKFNNQLNDRFLAQLRQELIQVEADGRINRAKKIRREISSLLEHNLAIQVTWCRGCLRYRFQCRCHGLEELGYSRSTRYRHRKKARAVEHKIRKIISTTQPTTGKELRRLRREEKARKADGG